MSTNDLFDVENFLKSLKNDLNKNRKDWENAYSKILPIDTSNRADDIVLRKRIEIPMTTTTFRNDTIIYNNSLDIPLPPHKMNYYEKRNTVNEKNFNSDKIGYLEKCQEIGIENMYTDKIIDDALGKI